MNEYDLIYDGDASYDVVADSQIIVNKGVVVKPLSVTENGTYQEDGTAYSPVTVDVPGLVPTGTLPIDQNGTYDVTEYAHAHASVKQWDEELAGILNGTATELRDLPSGVTKIKPYAFYSSFVQLEYAQSTGTQYLLTNLSYDASKTYKVIIDLQTVVSNDLVGVGWNAGGGIYFRSNKYGNGTTSGTTDIDASQRVVVTIDIGNGTSDYTFARTDGTVLATNSRANTALASWAANLKYPLFATNANTGAAPSLFFTGRIYAFKAYVNGVLTSDFIPVMHNGAVKFYNLVDGNYYQSAGTGILIGGGITPSPVDPTIESADLSVLEIGAYAFYANALSSLTLRANQVVTLGEHALDGTPIASGTGRIYVPSSLVNEYKTAWPSYAGVISSI